MRFNFTVQGDPVAMMEAEIDGAERAVTRGIGLASSGLKADWRGQVVSAGLGQRLANTVRANVYPERMQSISAAALVYSRAPVVVDAHDRGALIRSQSGLWLAIPLGPVAKMRGARGIGGKQQYRITPAGWEQKTGRRLRFIYRKGKPALLIDDGTPLVRSYTDPVSWTQRKKLKRTNRRMSVPIFLLVPQAQLRRKMDLDRASNAWGDRLPGLILDNWRDANA